MSEIRHNWSKCLCELALQLSKILVERPADVTVAIAEEPSGNLVIVLQVAQEDLVRVTGEGGRTARSLQTVIAAVGMKAQHHVTLRIDTVEPRVAKDGRADTSADRQR